MRVRVPLFTPSHHRLVARIAGFQPAEEGSNPSGDTNFMDIENREKVLKLFKTNKVLYFSDIAQKLNMDIEEVVDICRDLNLTGHIHQQL